MWEQFLHNKQQADANFALLSVAVDVEPERARELARGYAFTTVIDSSGVLGRLFDFDVVPNGVLVDEQGIIRHVHVGGFDVRRPEIAQQVEALLTADFAQGEQPTFSVQEPLDIEVLRTELVEHPDEAWLHLALGEALLREGRAADAAGAFSRAEALQPADWSAPFALGAALHQQGKTDEALRWWRVALERDPPNFTVRKQIWRIEHPEKFYPEIDLDWQKEQLAREGYSPPPR